MRRKPLLELKIRTDLLSPRGEWLPEKGGCPRQLNSCKLHRRKVIQSMPVTGDFALLDNMAAGGWHRLTWTTWHTLVVKLATPSGFWHVWDFGRGL